MGIYGLGRPAKPDVRVFQRNMDEGQRAILLVAGNGDMSAGWLEVLDTYHNLYELGYRPGMAIDAIRLSIPYGDQENAL